MRWTGAFLLAALFACALACENARADGCYVPEKAIAKIPAIPAQRAVLSFRDGRETLLVESALEGEGAAFGWVIPVPNRPESIEAATPGAIQSMALGIQPRIVHDLWPQVRGTLWLALLVFPVLAVWYKNRRADVPPVTRLIEPGVMLLLILLFTSLLLPAGLSARGEAGPAAGVHVLERGRVGSYEIAVLAAEDAGALYAWLDQEKLAIPAELRSAVSDYVKDGWRFVTAKLATDGAGAAVPHPLRITFPTERAVYPMKLTALSGSDLNLELYVIGDGAAEVPGLRRVYCEKFYAIAGESEGISADVRGTLGPHFLGQYSYQKLGHPGFVPALWDKCWVSKLAGKLAPEAMREDYYVSWRKPTYKQQTFYSRMGARCIGAIAAAGLLSLGAFAALAMWGHRRWTGGEAARRALLPGALAAGLAFGILLLALPQIEVTTQPGWHWPWHLQRDQRGLAAIACREGKEGESVRDAFRRLLGEGLAHAWNPYTGEPLREDDSPGNYTFSEADGKIVFTTYDRGGTPTRAELGEVKPERKHP